MAVAVVVLLSRAGFPRTAKPVRDSQSLEATLPRAESTSLDEMSSTRVGGDPHSPLSILSRVGRDGAEKIILWGRPSGYPDSVVDLHTAQNRSMISSVDPFKDMSGPSMNILINVMAIVSLVIAPML